MVRGNFILGKGNAATTSSKLTANVAAPALTLVNNSTAAAATALNITVPAGKAPLKVNAAAGTATNLSADKLDGKGAEDFYAAGSKVAAADAVDGKDSSVFAAGVDGKATDAELLDGKNSTSFMGRSIYTTEDWPLSFGAEKLDGTRVITKSCDVGDRLLAGGPANIDAGTILLESFPANTTTWHARIQNVGALDAFNVVVLCANQ